jgi:RHH-type proline utilization regulon transcriptional repressor/proline dehydrogenase/delta 1-pyrroline-5-carboxylate dehydrogenase
MERVEPAPEQPGLDDELISRSVALAADLMTRAAVLTGRRQGRQRARFRRLLASDTGTRFVFSLADRVLRPVNVRTAADQLAALTKGQLAGTSLADRALLRLAGVAGRVAPTPVVSLVAARLRRETASLVYPAEPEALGQRLAELWGEGRRPNLNLLGETILGWDEADRRTAALEALLRRPDVDCVSVKVSSMAAGLSLVDFAGSVDRISAPLLRLYRVALESDPPKLVNLDMEEHKDLDLTVAVFKRVLDQPDLASLTAGLALQAYLPDSHEALDNLLAWAGHRLARGGAPIRIRLVKGANLALETVEAELHGWPAAPYASKAETDASYKRLLERLIDCAATGAVRVGVASHNLFDIALALVLSDRANVDLDIEMLAGMADAQAAAVAERVGTMLFYVPTTSRQDFRNALAYLARRLNENATPDGFLRHALGMLPGSPAWEEQAAGFARAVRERDGVGTCRRQEQDRHAPGGGVSPTGLFGMRGDDRWVNEPDTDLTVPANRAWALRALAFKPVLPPSTASGADVEAAVARAVKEASSWSGASAAERRSLLGRAAEVMAAGRADAVSVMAAEAGKTFSEGDPEVSEAVDYARWYAREIDLIEALGKVVDSDPLGVVVVAPPWNFPYAIPAGGALAALAAGNTVILKPSPQAPGTVALLADQLWSAGFSAAQVQVVPAPDGPTGKLLVTHPGVGAVVLTGAVDTARLFLRWAPGRRLLAETSGKNAMVLSATTDVDQAVGDLVRSAFGHAGQKCSAASLAIVDASIHDHSPFLRQLADATRSLRVGMATDPATEVGPIVGPFTPALERALTRLDPGESWLVVPRLVDPEKHLWSPGVRIGVRPGSWAHLTEWFGPVLAVMRSDNLEDAIQQQNAIPYGLTAGLHSLDPDEHARWADVVGAGNLYINRPTTGAIVGRQPFGGWKGSSVGPTAKAGGPNYLLGLRRWRDAGPVSVEETRRDYRQWWDRYFSTRIDLADLACEVNVLRYRPFEPGIVLRMTADVSDEELIKAVAAAQITGTALRVSSSTPRHGLAMALQGEEVGVEVESGESFAARTAHDPGARIRLPGAPEPEVLAAAAEHGVTVLDEPICSHGRIELVRWLREQSLSRSLHRYGNVVYRR